MGELLSPEKIKSIKEDFPFTHWVKEGAKAQLAKCHRDRPEREKDILNLLKYPPKKLRSKENPVGEVNLEKLAGLISALFPDIEQAKREERERIGDILSVSENELGFIEISNHVPYKEWQALKEGEK